MLGKILKLLVGDKSKKDLKLINPVIEKIHSFEQVMNSLSNDELRAQTNEFKNQINNSIALDVDSIIENISEKYSHEKTSSVDGLKIDFEDSWVQLRKSNTEPIIRVYSEAKSQKSADELSAKFISEIKNLS